MLLRGQRAAPCSCEYEIVTPTRVNEFGEPFPTDVHFRRRRRSTSAHYRLSAFGQQFLFNLTASSAFIAPLFTVSLLGEPAADQRRLYAEAADADVKHCFYRGHVNARPRLTAVISLCSGMLGTFKSDDGDYFVEPLLSLEEQEYEEEHNKPHLVYRHRTPPTNSSGDWQTCNTPGTHFLTASDDLILGSAILNSFSGDSNKTGTIGERKSHKRTKRFLSYPRFVEVMVVADSRMVAYHGANLQHYVLTLMSIVASIYKDPSIGNLINIVIVKLDGPAISYNAQTTLKNFCQWQQSQNHPEGSHLRHDTAVLVTRQDICRAHDKCDTLGLAELGTVCDPYRSCSISEDNGLSTAFTIAHELGHVFNMPHDDNHKCKEDGGKNQQHVMAPTLNFYTNPWMWSKCSRKYITEFLDTGYGECLLDEPSSRTYTLPQQLPGLIYDVNKQCELIFGPGSQVCPYMMQCRRLWCINVDGAHKGCRTQHTPWADGTECEPGKHCRFGMCVPKEREAPVTDGAWGTWSPFGTCSRTCGGGIKTAIRECNRPEPKNGGKYCVGRRMKFKSCNTEPCSKLKKDFRDEQCADFDGKHFNINGLPTNVRWVPKYSGILMKDRCKLFCRVAGNTAYYQLRDRVIDGTPCGPDTNDICVQGLCRQAGCDHVLNSKARRDKCGVCGGDNSSCKTVAGTFNTVHYGYNVVVRIPAGATNIDVRQHSYSGKPEDDNYLALSNSQGDFILNGDFVVSMFKREIKVGNAVIEYSGSDNTVERINSTDRIEQEITLQVLSVGNLYNPDVRYTFNIPIEDKPQQRPPCHRARVLHAHPPFPLSGSSPQCSSTCAGGFQRRVVVCQDENGYTANNCDEKSKPMEQRSCESGPCPQWAYGNWGECTKPCGGGTRTRLVVCQRPNGERFTDLSCEILDKPPDREQCNVQDCPRDAAWSAGPWSSVRP
uniref:Peptidase M12B domain-containing protein n=3 Tax=Passeriformes TaxID=9126 RepID=A0A8C3NAR5_GEOPR